MKPPKLVQYPGLKEEYYLSDFEPDRSLLERFGVDPERVLVVLRPRLMCRSITANRIRSSR